MAYSAISANDYLIVEVGGLLFQGYLQSDYISFYQGLPVSGLGCWPTTNHQLGIGLMYLLWLKMIEPHNRPTCQD